MNSVSYLTSVLKNVYWYFPKLKSILKNFYFYIKLKIYTILNTSRNIYAILHIDENEHFEYKLIYHTPGAISGTQPPPWTPFTCFTFLLENYVFAKPVGNCFIIFSFRLIGLFVIVLMGLSCTFSTLCCSFLNRPQVIFLYWGVWFATSWCTHDAAYLCMPSTCESKL